MDSFASQPCRPLLQSHIAEAGVPSMGPPTTAFPWKNGAVQPEVPGQFCFWEGTGGGGRSGRRLAVRGSARAWNSPL